MRGFFASYCKTTQTLRIKSYSVLWVSHLYAAKSHSVKMKCTDNETDVSKYGQNYHVCWAHSRGEKSHQSRYKAKCMSVLSLFVLNGSHISTCVLLETSAIIHTNYDITFVTRLFQWMHISLSHVFHVLGIICPKHECSHFKQ